MLLGGKKRENLSQHRPNSEPAAEAFPMEKSSTETELPWLATLKQITRGPYLRGYFSKFFQGPMAMLKHDL